MILKDRRILKDKRANPLIGVALFLISIILFILTASFGLVYGILYSLYKKGLRGISEYLLKIAISVDQLGNVLMQHLLNLLWLKKGAYKFGNRDETISSAIGRNKKLGLLSGFGRLIDNVLDKIDPNHSLNSIDYYIEPTEQIIDKIAWIYIKKGRILTIRSRNKSQYSLPSGQRNFGESDSEALMRVIKEELTIDLLIDTLKPVGIFEAKTDGRATGILIRKTCHNCEFREAIAPGPEIEEVVWLNYTDREMVSHVDQLIFDFLKEKNLLF